MVIDHKLDTCLHVCPTKLPYKFICKCLLNMKEKYEKECGIWERTLGHCFKKALTQRGPG